MSVWVIEYRSRREGPKARWRRMSTERKFGTQQAAQRRVRQIRIKDTSYRTVRMAR